MGVPSKTLTRTFGSFHRLPKISTRRYALKTGRIINGNYGFSIEFYAWEGVKTTAPFKKKTTIES